MFIRLTSKVKFLALPFAVAAFLVLSPTPVRAAYTDNNIIDDSIFLNSGSMSQAEIQNFLNSKGGAIASYSAPNTDPGQNNRLMSAAEIIYFASQYIGINPQVIMATMQKEQSLVTDPSPSAAKYNYAMGYGCPDSGGCSGSSGFYYQVVSASFQLRFNFERAGGSTGTWVSPSGKTWGSNPSYACPSATRYYSTGLYAGRSVTFYSDNATAYKTFNLDNRGTASMYCYTPHAYNPSGIPQYYSGSYNFVTSFESWWGTTKSGRCNENSVGPVVSDVLFEKYDRNIDYANLIVYSGTTTNCIESHVWNPGMQSWKTHITSNQQVVSYPDVQEMAGDLDGTGLDYPLLFGVQGTSTNKVESHVWQRDMRSWLAHTVSNQPVINPADCKIITADLDGDQKEEPILICLRNTTTGKIELHTWNPGMQSWRNHIVTNMPVVDPAQATVVVGDIDGNGADELVLVAYNHTGSGKVEFHVWNSGQQSWWYHIATNLSEIDSFQSKVEFGDIDGNRVDEAVLVSYKNTGSGKIEFHIWNPGYYSWRSHIASNQPTL